LMGCNSAVFLGCVPLTPSLVHAYSHKQGSTRNQSANNQLAAHLKCLASFQTCCCQLGACKAVVGFRDVVPFRGNLFLHYPNAGNCLLAFDSLSALCWKIDVLASSLPANIFVDNVAMHHI
uniref:Uncharacterized protein n=1 Tax=Phasianus colchicus TaxID=9054 RepID=A0A669QTY2_PHACC